MTSIGVVPNDQARKGRYSRPNFEGIARDTIIPAEPIPTDSVTVPSDSSPPLRSAADKYPSALQETDKIRLQEVDRRLQEEQKRTRQRNQDENQQEDRIRGRNQEETQEEGQDEAQDQDKLRSVVKKQQEETGDEEDDSTFEDENYKTSKRKEEQRK